MPKDSLEEAVKELYFWQFGTNPTNFTAQLYSLFQKADMSNKARLSAVFPFEAEALKRWEIAKDQNEFFALWGLGVKAVKK